MKNQIEQLVAEPNLYDGDLAKIIKALQHDQIVTIPTETVYGYAVCLSSIQGIQDLMRLKNRAYDSGKVFTLVPVVKTDIANYAIIPEYAKAFIEQFVPGEITLIFRKNPSFCHPYYDHFDTIGIRIPNHPLFAELLPQTGSLLLTSANPRGGTPKSTTGHLPSTIVDCTGSTPKILRQGDLLVKI